MNANCSGIGLCLAAVLSAAAIAAEPAAPQDGGLLAAALPSAAPLPPDATFMGPELASYETAYHHAMAEEEGESTWPEREFTVGDQSKYVPRAASGYPSNGDEEENYKWRFGAWLDQGISVAGNHPVDRFNGVVLMDDRSGEYQMNQLWLYLERQTPVRDCGWSWGGRMDVVYGTDALFMQCVDGLEANWRQTERFYQMALPQFYLDFAYHDWTVRVGHFITPLGYESFMAPDNFFYSLSYLYSYAVPGTCTGMTVRWDFTDQWMVFSGLTRGGDQFDDTDGLNAWSYIGGISWSSEDDKTYVDFALSAEEHGVDDVETVFSLVTFTELTEQTTYMIEFDRGSATGSDSEWYGINQEVTRKLRGNWSGGARFEWFRDDDGEVVSARRLGNVAQGPFVGNFWEATLGLRWEPRERVTIRPEVRWDWFTPDSPGEPMPFDSGGSNAQVMFGVDLITVF